MSPEQVRGQEADARSDVFSLGVILYEMVWGRRAFAGVSRVETMSAILRDDPLLEPPPEGVPASVVRVVARCLEKDPKERFRSARDLAFALEAVGGGIASGAEGRPSAAWPGGAPGRRPGRLASLASGLALFGFGVLATLVGERALAPGPPPRVTGYRPILGGLPRTPAAWATDGQRVYYTIDREGRHEVWQAPLAGGEPARVEVPFEQALVADASPQHSAILVVGWNGGLTEYEQRDLPLWIVPVPAGAARNTGLSVRSAAWSPDGERLAATGGSDDYGARLPGSVLVASADGSAVREIYRSDAEVQWIRWSPDGRRLRFGAFDAASSEWWCLEVPSDGSAPATRVGRGQQGAWSADGGRFVFGEWGTRGGIQGAGPRFNLYSAPGRGAWRDEEAAALTFGPFDFSGPVFTPGGRSIVAAGMLLRMELLRYVGGRSGFERAADLPGSFVEFSPDGEWIAWLDPSSLTLWRSRRDGSGRLQLTVPPAAVGLFQWSPDSRRLVFVADKAGGREPGAVHVLSRDGGTPESFADPNGNSVWDPCWLGASTIAWGNLRGEGAAVWTAELGSRRVAKLPGSELMMGPKCSPDGRVLAARAWSLGYWLYAPRKGRWESLGQPSDLWYPTFARDGVTVYGLSLDQRAVYRFRIGRPGREKVADLGPVQPTAPWFDAWMGLDPSDAPLVLRGSGLTDLFVLDYEG